MPTIPTFSGDLPFQAGFQRGKSARQIFDEENTREDARFEANLQLQEERLRNEAESNELSRLFELQEQSREDRKFQIEQENKLLIADRKNELEQAKLTETTRKNNLNFAGKVLSKSGKSSNLKLSFTQMKKQAEDIIELATNNPSEFGLPQLEERFNNLKIAGVDDNSIDRLRVLVSKELKKTARKPGFGTIFSDRTNESFKTAELPEEFLSLSATDKEKFLKLTPENRKKFIQLINNRK